MGEFELIRRFFAEAACARTGQGLVLGIGDDCALLELAPGEQLAVSTDSLVAGVHFPDPCDPFLLAQRALACAASDLAAMGAAPLGFSLALTLPAASADWLQGFSAGLEKMAAACDLRLIGGDTTRGPLNINITVFGRLPAGQALLRSGARPGDLLCVGGCLGDAAGALPYVLGQRPAIDSQVESLLAHYWTPAPQLALGQALRGRASAAQDISDGLLGDCAHIASASDVALVVELERVPLSQALLAVEPIDTARRHALSGGDDYVLLFCLPPEQLDALLAEGWPVQVIGRVEAGEGVHLRDAAGRPLSVPAAGFQHFSR
ncbi:thiamine-phosphate kinase [Pseudomonas mangrovi]|uniref:Thiamine-monophosphate kinase n=1 Tax=Pseudomonas mangrovi TaxID=2161748 RepID=A0A2T5P8S0_9PSED|nr:thiamine-phosphate kinase [Pseudomonas mangrovi]PTU74139.1 thiamine-phosphate kinase [Pseudomonas mangrovi]